MKVRRQGNRRLVLLERRAWPFLATLALLVAALGIALFGRARHELDCEAGSEQRSCQLSWESLFGQGQAVSIPAAEVRGIEIARTGEDDDPTYCVVVVTASATHEVDRCSRERERRLGELVDELGAFYAGEAPAVRRAWSNAGPLLLFTILLGLGGLAMLAAPTVCRAELDAEKGVVKVRFGAWLWPERWHAALGDVVSVSVHRRTSHDGSRLQRLYLETKDARRLPVGEESEVDLEPVRASVDAFLSATRRGYR